MRKSRDCLASVTTTAPKVGGTIRVQSWAANVCPHCRKEGKKQEDGTYVFSCFCAARLKRRQASS